MLKEHTRRPEGVAWGVGWNRGLAEMILQSSLDWFWKLVVWGVVWSVKHISSNRIGLVLGRFPRPLPGNIGFSFQIELDLNEQIEHN